MARFTGVLVPGCLLQQPSTLATVNIALGVLAIKLLGIPSAVVLLVGYGYYVFLERLPHLDM
jgi:hypothetical protein